MSESLDTSEREAIDATTPAVHQNMPVEPGRSTHLGHQRGVLVSLLQDLLGVVKTVEAESQTEADHLRDLIAQSEAAIVATLQDVRETLAEEASP
jgi:hypothetical protein